MSCERLPYIPDSPDDDLVLMHQFRVSETYPLHTHEFYEIFYVVRGQAIHEINGLTQVVGEGALVFIRPQALRPCTQRPGGLGAVPGHRPDHL